MAPVRRTELNFPRFIALTAARTLLANESGAIVHNVGMTAGVVLTLPPIGDGPYWFKVIQGAGYAITVTADLHDTMITFNDATADSVTFSTSAEIIAGSFEVYCDGTSLWVLPQLASEAQTLTVST